jgi:hypothetical protein
LGRAEECWNLAGVDVELVGDAPPEGLALLPLVRVLGPVVADSTKGQQVANIIRHLCTPAAHATGTARPPVMHVELGVEAAALTAPV